MIENGEYWRFQKRINRINDIRNRQHRSLTNKKRYFKYQKIRKIITIIGQRKMFLALKKFCRQPKYKRVIPNIIFEKQSEFFIFLHVLIYRAQKNSFAYYL